MSTDPDRMASARPLRRRPRAGGCRVRKIHQFAHKAISREFSNVAYMMVLEDGTKIEPDSLEALLDYENPDFKQIASLSVHTEGTSVVDTIELVLGEATPASRSSGTIFIGSMM